MLRCSGSLDYSLMLPCLPEKHALANSGKTSEQSGMDNTEIINFKREDENGFLVKGGYELNPARKLTYRFLTLPYQDIIKIGIELNLIEDRDEGLLDFELVRNLAERAKEKGLLHKLMEEVENKHSEPVE